MLRLVCGVLCVLLYRRRRAGPSLPEMVNPENPRLLKTADDLVDPVVYNGVRCMSYGWSPRGKSAAMLRGWVPTRVCLVASMLLAGFASSSIVGGGAPRSFPLSRSHSTIQYMLTCAIAMTSSHFFRPMVSGVVTQLARGTDWGVLDVLVIDMPPGTGDIHITMGQQVEMTAAVVRKVNCVASRGHCWWHSAPHQYFLLRSRPTDYLLTRGRCWWHSAPAPPQYGWGPHPSYPLEVPLCCGVSLC